MVPVLIALSIVFCSLVSIMLLTNCSKKAAKSKTPTKTVSQRPPAPTSKIAPVKPAESETTSTKTEEKKEANKEKPAETKSVVDKPEEKKDADKNERSKKGAEKEKQEDTFDKLQPKAVETKRKEEIAGKKAENKGDYKTWNKVIENSEFNKTLSEKDEKEKKDDKKKDDKEDKDDKEKEKDKEKDDEKK